MECRTIPKYGNLYEQILEQCARLRQDYEYGPKTQDREERMNAALSQLHWVIHTITEYKDYPQDKWPSETKN